MNSLADLIARAVRIAPDAPFGTFSQHDRLDQAVARAWEIADQLRASGLGRGAVAAVIGNNCASYLTTFIAAQFAGVQTALINPGYPDEFLATMLDDLQPDAIIWVARTPQALTGRDILQLDLTHAWEGRIERLRDGPVRALVAGDGRDCARHEIAAYLHTSGTSGNPKFCALSHGYFHGLGRFVADSMCLTRHDVMIAPLPLFHINPLGNGVIGALTVGAGVLSADRFSATDFWTEVKAHGGTALMLHGPPAGLLKAKTTRQDAAGHQVRIGFFCDPAFLEQFDVPVGIGGYGSTEAGGYCHTQKYRVGDVGLPPEGATHLSGQPRPDVDWRLDETGEILIRGKRPQVLFEGYARGGTVDPSLDEDGWFHTGDRGRLDDLGNLVFIERSSESIRVNAEYVPIDLVEDRLRRVASLGEFALWRIDSLTRGHEAVIYTTAPKVDLAQVQAAVADLPRYMHPTRILSIAAIPRDIGVGKIQRRLLSEQPVIGTQMVTA